MLSLIHIYIADIIADADSSYIPSPDEVRFPAGGDVAEILFSTGTTGKSKGIVLTHTNDTALAENVMFGVRMKTDNVEIVPMLSLIHISTSVIDGDIDIISCCIYDVLTSSFMKKSSFSDWLRILPASAAPFPSASFSLKRSL